MDWKNEDLVFACYGRNYPQARELLKLGADPNVRPPEEWWEDDPEKWQEFCTPIHYACKHGELEFVKLLVEEYKCNLNIRDGIIRSPLHIACQYGHLDIVQYIVKKKGGLNLIEDTASNNMTPLHFACQYGHTEVVEYLIGELGCQLDVFDVKNQSPLHYACQKGNSHIVYNLCEHGCNLEVRDSNQSTPLHIASKRGYLDIVKYLLEHGCNPDVTDASQWTPLHYACQYGHIDIVKCLFAHGCSPELMDVDKYTPLHVAVNKWKCIDKLSLEVVKFLISVAHVSKQKTANGDDALLLASREGRFEMMQFLIADGQYDANVQDKNGNTPLHYACQKSKAFNWKPIIKWLLEEAGSDPNVKNNEGTTPFQMATDNGMILELLRYGATPSNVYTTYGNALGLKHPLQPSFHLFVVGSYSTGKSTLMTAFRKVSSILTRAINRRRRVTGVREKTTGIVPHEFQSRQFGHISLFDCAGRNEFHDSHAALLHNAVQRVPPVFVIVVNMAQSSEEIRQDILYWFSLLQSQCPAVSNANVIIVGSHADILLARGEDPNPKLQRIVTELPQFKSTNSPACITMNCQYSESTGMTQFRRTVKRCSDAAHISAAIYFNTHCLYVFILNRFGATYAVSLRQIQTSINNEMTSATERNVAYFLPSSVSGLHKVCKELNDQTDLLYLINSASIQDSWIIINKPALLSEVIGTIFAPKDFKQHGQLASSLGIVPLPKIKELFSQYDPEMLVGFLSTLEHCLEISRQEITQSLPQHVHSEIEDTQTSNDRYLLFPGLVTLEMPNNIWEASPQYTEYCGWVLQCSDPNQFFTPHFIQALILRLLKSLTLSPEFGSMTENTETNQIECTLWKNGFHWRNVCGIETLVEQLPQSKEIVLLMRCKEECVVKCLQIRSHIIQIVLKTAGEICGNVSKIESFIDPAEVTQYPLKSIEEIDLFRVSDIAKAVATSTPSIVSRSGKQLPLQDVTMFEPFALLGELLLRVLFDNQTHSYHGPLPDGFVSQIAKDISCEKDKFVEIFKTVPTLGSKQDSMSSHDVDMIAILRSWTDECDGTYELLRETLGQYSAFSGRNPLELAGSDMQVSVPVL